MRFETAMHEVIDAKGKLVAFRPYWREVGPPENAVEYMASDLTSFWLKLRYGKSGPGPEYSPSASDMFALDWETEDAKTEHHLVWDEKAQRHRSEPVRNEGFPNAGDKAN